MRHVADLADVGLPRMQQSRHRLSRAVRRRDGLSQSSAYDTTRGLLPRDRDQGAEGVPGEDTRLPVPRERGRLVRPNYK